MADTCVHGNTDNNVYEKKPYNICPSKTNRKLEIYKAGLRVIDGWIAGRLKMMH